MGDTPHVRELGIEELDAQIDTSELAFATTDELQPLTEIIGQPRALQAFELGLGISGAGYNIYAAGISGSGKETMARQTLLKNAAQQPTPPDWVYVNNFDREDNPMAIPLPAGQGKRLKRDMEQLIKRLREEVPKAFRQEDFSREKQRLSRRFQEQGRDMQQQLQQDAENRGLMIQQGPDGTILMLPSKDDRPMRSEEFESLPEEEKEIIGQKQQELGEHVSRMVARQREMERQLRSDVQEVERNFATRIIGPMIDEVAEKYENGKVHQWFAMARRYMIENLDQFREEDSRQQQVAAMLGIAGPAAQRDSFERYEVNVVVDNSDVEGAPVVFEGSPNYKNLFGTIHGTADPMGRFSTNFTNIKAGSLLRANGGYLVFDLVQALLEPLVWKELKRTIKSHSLEYHMYDPFGVFATSALKPEPIPLNVKLVLTGNPLVYHLLQLYDEDFREIVKVKADFARELDREPGMNEQLAQFVRKLKDDSNVMAFEPGSVGELVRIGARLAGDKRKITAEFGRLADLVREASYWARRAGASTVGREHVRKAVDEKVYRSNLIAARIREMIAEGVIRIDVDRTVVGQLNGLSVAHLGDYMFGRPSRVTASVGIGATGLINIERESRLSGQTYDKGMMILDGFIRNRYAREHPIALSAGLAMEQSYGLIEGDSASIVELVCLLSAIANVPLRQDIAITGSVDQRGQAQAVGAVSEKVEGFHDVCRELGFTGNQGVCLPSANVRNLVLRPDVIESVQQQRFHVWSFDHVNQIIPLLTGMPAGDLDEPGTFHWQVDQELRRMLQVLKEQRIDGREREIRTELAAHAPQDPRPPLPGRDTDDG
ncbi:MAG: AAA family ATPase [Chitinivibrionales bacterium]|nr:AAA family ATPase [Chitinivibrionales bacterium]